MDTITLKIMWTALIIFMYSGLIVLGTKPKHYKTWAARVLISILVTSGIVTMVSLLILTWS